MWIQIWVTLHAYVCGLSWRFILAVLSGFALSASEHMNEAAAESTQSRKAVGKHEDLEQSCVLKNNLVIKAWMDTNSAVTFWGGGIMWESVINQRMFWSCKQEYEWNIRYVMHANTAVGIYSACWGIHPDCQCKCKHSYKEFLTAVNNKADNSFFPGLHFLSALIFYKSTFKRWLTDICWCRTWFTASAMTVQASLGSADCCTKSVFKLLNYSADSHKSLFGHICRHANSQDKLSLL